MAVYGKKITKDEVAVYLKKDKSKVTEKVSVVILMIVIILA